MTPSTLSNLQWDLLLDKLAGHAQTTPARQLCLNLPVNLSKTEIEQRWEEVEPIRALVSKGYTPPVGELGFMEPIFKSIKVGQILDGEALRDILVLLDTTKRVQRFTLDFGGDNRTLGNIGRLLYPLPKLMAAISSSIGPNGEILDTASPELARIRAGKSSLRTRIEHEIRQLLVSDQIETYLQDKFFTIRADRYVIPIRLDGRGRVKGSIYDTSASGQTLYIEPAKIAPLNEELLELELSEKLEIIRIFRELSATITTEYDILFENYQNIIKLDFLTAQALLAQSYHAVAVPIVDRPILSLYNARHPLVTSPDNKPAIPNDILLGDNQTSLIISGPNAGGKTVVLKTVGIIHLMAKAGLMLPVDERSRIYLFDQVYISLGDAQNLTAGLSTFSGHIQGLNPIIEKATAHDLVLLDELAVGTDPQTGSAIAQAILENLAARAIHTISSTHFDALKGLAVTDRSFRNGSMEFSFRHLKPTYKLVLDLPGQSFGIEVAQQMGLEPSIIERATQLKGASGTHLDKLVDALGALREEAREEKERAERMRLEMEEQKAHFQRECQAVAELRRTVTAKIREKYDSQIQDIRREANEAIESMHKLISEARRASKNIPQLQEEFQRRRHIVRENVGRLNGALDELNQDAFSPQGGPLDYTGIKVGDKVIVATLKQEGVIRKISSGELTPASLIEVAIGSLNVKVRADQLLSPGSKAAELAPAKPRTQSPKGTRPEAAPAGAGTPEGGKTIEFAISTPTNSLDLRGRDVDSAISATWQFIDKAVLRGEKILIIIHGHGTDRLKRALRSELGQNSPYPLSFRPGEDKEGGDGVTVIKLGD
jgi:DNA mismatch repair protein MutS2